MRCLKKIFFVVTVFICSHSLSKLYSQELHINNLNATTGNFQYSRGDSIYIAGDNDTVSLSDSLTMSLEGPKIMIGKSTSADQFSTGSFKAFYDSYQKVKVIPEISPGDTLSNISLSISGGTPPYTIDWLTFNNSDSIIFDTVSDILQGMNFTSLFNTIQTKYHDSVFNGLAPGVYTCRISDISTVNYYDFVIGNTWGELDLLNCYTNPVYDIVASGTGNNWDSYFSYSSYFPFKSDWRFSSCLSDTSTYTMGVSDTTEMLDSTDIEYGIFVDKGVLMPIVGRELCSEVIKYEQQDNISMMFKNNAFVIKLNGNIVFKRYVINASEQNYAFVGNLKSGSVILPQLFLPIIIHPTPIAIVPKVEKQHLICGVQNSGRICTTFPSYVNWPAGYLNNGECMYNLPADNYTITYQSPFNTSITTELGYMSSWITEGLQMIDLSGLKNENISTAGTAFTAQKIPNGNDSQWVELELGFENTTQALMIFVLTNESNTTYVGFGILSDPNTGNALPILFNSDFSNVFIGSLFSPGENELFKIRTGGTGNDWNIYRCYYQNSMYIEQDITPGFNFSAPDLTNTHLLSIIYPGDAKVLQAATSFGCDTEQPYFELKKKIEGQNYPVSLADGNIRFAYEEPYLDNGTGDQLSIYKYSGNNVGSPCTVTGFNSAYGYNEYEVSIASCGFSVGDVGLLELRTEKNEKWFLRFKIVE